MEEAGLYTTETKQIHIPNVQKDVEFIMEHLNDPNFDLSRLPSPFSVSVLEEESTSYVGEEDSGTVDFDESVLFYPPILFTFLTTYCSVSPYPEVRSTVSNSDDPRIPVNTFRMWFLGILLTLLTSGLNQVLNMRCMTLSYLSRDTISFIFISF